MLKQSKLRGLKGEFNDFCVKGKWIILILCAHKSHHSYERGSPKRIYFISLLSYIKRWICDKLIFGMTVNLVYIISNSRFRSIWLSFLRDSCRERSVLRSLFKQIVSCWCNVMLIVHIWWINMALKGSDNTLNQKHKLTEHYKHWT